MYLTDRKIVDLCCPQGLIKTAIRDPLSPGLVIEVSSTSPAKRFRFRYRFRGEQRSIALGSTASGRLEDARQLVRRFQSQIDLGIDPKPTFKRKKHPLRFSEFVTSVYFPLERPVKKSISTDETIFRCHLANHFGEFFLDQIEEQLLFRFFDQIRARYKPATHNRIKHCLSHMFTVAIQRGLMQGPNPVGHIPSLRENNHVVRYLSHDELARLRSALKTSRSKLLLLFVELSIATGARYSELLSLTWSDVDLARAVCVLRNTKNGKDRHLPLSKSAISHFQGLRQVSGITGSVYCFSHPRTGQPMRSFKSAWKRACERADLEHFRFHDLRHTFASALVQSGVSIYEVKELLGHSSVVTTQRYAHLSPERLRCAVEAGASYWHTEPSER